MSTRWKQGMLALPSIGVSILPKLACPACWPAYAGLLTSIGLEFFDLGCLFASSDSAFLLLALGAMLFRAKARRGYGPFLLGVLAGIGVLVGKFVWESSPAMYGAVGLLVIASLWNTWPRRDKPDEARTCSHCNTEKVERSI